MLVLGAVGLGLGTCWVGGSFARGLCPFDLSGGETIVCTITIGNVLERDTMRESLIRGMTHRRSKTAEQMFTADGPAPGWFMEGMRAVQKAPSAVNRQPVRFTLERGRITACVENYADVGAVLDLGIAKAHFELGAGDGTWAFGNHGAFARTTPPAD